MAGEPQNALPTGTVTFLFTDIEGSTRLVQQLGDAYREVLEAQIEILRSALRGHQGIEVGMEGDSMFAVFVSALDAVEAAGEAQRSLAAHPWPEGSRVRVRMGLHTGSGTAGGGNYVGLDVHRAARIAAAAHGGQTVLSMATAILVERALPSGMSLRGLGKHRLKDLAEQEEIFQLTVAGLDGDFPPLVTLDAVHNNLPLQVTSFIGREEELRDATGLLERTRVLTLTGPGGTGKSRLALQLAAEVAEQYPDGVHWVELASVAEAENVPSTILAALGFQAAATNQSPIEGLLANLRSRNLLMVLDNFEQLLSAAPLVYGMVQESVSSKFVVTSRAPLHINGEQEMAVPPLEIIDLHRLPGPEQLLRIAAVRLFVERAVAAAPGFSLTPRNAEAVAALVARLDGLPLAIELVAARVKLLPVETILARLDLTRMAPGSRNLPPRQQTLHNAIDWSYDLLDEPARRLFARMSVFAGGARLEEIEEVCGPDTELGSTVLDALATLVDHSLVHRMDGGDEPRFGMLGVLREYAADRLRTDPAAGQVRRNHTFAYVHLAETAGPRLLGAARKRWLDALQADHDNLRAALRWAVDSDETDLAMRIAWSAWRFWQARGHLYEAQRHVEDVLAMPGGEPAHRAKALEACGGIAWWQGNTEMCDRFYRRALEIQRSLGDPAEIANALYNLALAVAFGAEGGEQATAMLDEAESLYRELDSAGGLADINWARGSVLVYAGGDLGEGREYFARCVDLYRRAGNEFGLGWALFEYGDTSRRLGDVGEARNHLLRGLRLFHEHGDISAAVLFLASLAALARDLGDEEEAVRLAGAMQSLRMSSGTDIVAAEPNQAAGLDFAELERLTGRLADVYREGQEMDFETAVAYVLGQEA